MDSAEDLFGHGFRDPSLLEEALTHKSYAYERSALRHNERLEFLGDSVLAAVVAHRLFLDNPGEDEGRLSKMKASLVSRPTLARWAEQIALGPHLKLGTGEESTGGRERPSILANALEAVIGALYLDGGYEAARKFVTTRFLSARDEFVETDFKSRLQEVVQKRHKVPPEYRLVQTTGPDHDKTFKVSVLVGARSLGAGEGKTKKEAEQDAAQNALRKIARRAAGNKDR
ncbi:MAG: ribonuclease III [Elusimicrobia bacterium]|nr:ribonuclease III [Elusimicrobiota bacterium]